MYFRTKPNSWWPCSVSCSECIFISILSLRGFGIAEPFVERLLVGLHRQQTGHFVMGKTAQFRTGDLKSILFEVLSIGGEPNLDPHSGNGILFQPEVGKEEAMNHVIGFYSKQYSLIVDDLQYRRLNVVLAGSVAGV